MAVAVEFDWSKEVNQVITKSLVTTFGLDFLLLEDKKGGDVDTVHNVRQGVWATDKEKQAYKQREKYNSDSYHQHDNYIKTGEIHKKLQEEGKLQDAYRNYKTFDSDRSKEQRNLDHVISAYEVHHDAGRILSGLDGVDLANQDSNLSVTGSTINQVKNLHSIEKFLGQPLQQSMADREKKIAMLHKKLGDLLPGTQEYIGVQKTLEIQEQWLQQLKDIDVDEMRKIDQQARDKYNQQVDTAYYKSSKFFKNSAIAAGIIGVKMGVRESLGLICAEIWFEMKEQIPVIYKKYKEIKFKINEFLNDLKDALINIIERVKLRFKDLISSFRDGAISGIFSSLTTTILNIFLTTAKFWGKIIRETWLNIVEITKLVFFNPENLSTGELTKACFKILSASIGILVGVITNESLVMLKTIPFGDQISIFLSSLVSGIVILGLNYFIEQSPLMQKLWAYLNQFKTKYEKACEHFKEINVELDRYVLELTQLEFAINIEEMQIFANQLKQSSNEFERNILLKQQIEKQEIKLPFEMGNNDSTKNWLLGLAKK